MTKEKAIKYDGDWIQVATHDMDQVFLYAGKLFEFCLKILVEYGMGWALRKIAGLMTVQLSLEAQEDGIISTLKTRIKSNKVLNLYEGVTHTTGLKASEVRYSFCVIEKKISESRNNTLVR